jgi:hypothetical protein
MAELSQHIYLPLENSTSTLQAGMRRRRRTDLPCARLAEIVAQRVGLANVHHSIQNPIRHRQVEGSMNSRGSGSNMVHVVSTHVGQVARIQCPNAGS